VKVEELLAGSSRIGSSITALLRAALVSLFIEPHIVPLQRQSFAQDLKQHRYRVQLIAAKVA
jgi:hypothetical protein